MKSIDGEGKRREGVDFDSTENPEVGRNISQRNCYVKFRGLTQLRTGWG